MLLRVIAKILEFFEISDLLVGQVVKVLGLQSGVEQLLLLHSISNQWYLHCGERQYSSQV